MQSAQQPSKQNHFIVFGTIWFALFIELFFLQHFLGGGIPAGEQSGQAPLAIQALCCSTIILASIIRWLVIPKIKKVQQLLVVMIVGLAIAEATQFFQLFLIGSEFPKTQMTFWVLSIFAVGQFFPIYLKNIEIKEPMKLNDL